VLLLARLIAASDVAEPPEPARTKPYRVSEVAGMLDVHISTVYKEIQRGNLRALRTGIGRGAIRIPVDALAEYERDTENRAAAAREAS